MINRKYPRLKNYDYSANGAYFITLVCHRRINRFGEIKTQMMVPTTLGSTVVNSWHQLPRRYPSLITDAFILMPNHLHGIVWLANESPYTMSNIINWFKAGITREANIKVWQRSFYDRVIRDEHELFYARKYIEENPMRWELDRLFINDKNTSP